MALSEYLLNINEQYFTKNGEKTAKSTQKGQKGQHIQRNSYAGIQQNNIQIL